VQHRDRTRPQPGDEIGRAVDDGLRPGRLLECGRDFVRGARRIGALREETVKSMGWLTPPPIPVDGITMTRAYGSGAPMCRWNVAPQSLVERLRLSLR
jgi:hypothetical protein